MVKVGVVQMFAHEDLTKSKILRDGSKFYDFPSGKMDPKK